MNKLGIGLVAVLALLALGVSWAGPISGGTTKHVQIEPKDTHVEKVRFKGGRRACVIVEGDHQPIVNIHLSIKDLRGATVTEDRAGGDVCSVIWYPAHDADYVITISHEGNIFNRCLIAIK